MRIRAAFSSSARSSCSFAMVEGGGSVLMVIKGKGAPGLTQRQQWPWKRESCAGLGSKESRTALRAQSRHPQCAAREELESQSANRPASSSASAAEQKSQHLALDTSGPASAPVRSMSCSAENAAAAPEDDAIAADAEAEAMALRLLGVWTRLWRFDGGCGVRGYGDHATLAHI